MEDKFVTTINLGQILNVTNGERICTYKVLSVGKYGYTMMRVKRARTKIDNIRFPDRVTIQFKGTPVG